MKMVKSLLLGAAAGVVGVAGAQAADLPVKAKPVQYVKICSLYGAGFYYMPGTDTCIKIGGFVRAEVNYLAGGSYSVHQTGAFGAPSDGNNEFWRTRAGVTLDTRSQTEYGTLRSYFIMATTADFDGYGNSSVTAGVLSPGTYGGTGVGNNPGGTGRAPYTRLWSNAAFIQFAGFTAGKTASFFDFDLQPYSNQTNFWSSNAAGGGIQVFAYTAQFGNGLSASISVEDPGFRRLSITDAPAAATVAAPAAGWQYGNVEVPDVVGNLRIDQAWGSAQVMGAYHQVRGVNHLTANTTQTTAEASGWAFGAGAKFNVPMLGKGDYVQAQFTYSKGALLYSGSGMNGGFAATNSDGTVNYSGPAFDAVATTAAGNLELTTAWSITGGFEHFWNTQWKTSLYGAYGEVSYSDAAAAVIRPATAAAGSSANWNFAQIGSRTTWTPVANLDLSLEAMYNRLDGAWATGTAQFGDKDWVSGIFRVQRNFYP